MACETFEYTNEMASCHKIKSYAYKINTVVLTIKDRIERTKFWSTGMILVMLAELFVLSTRQTHAADSSLELKNN